MSTYTVFLLMFVGLFVCTIIYLLYIRRCMFKHMEQSKLVNAKLPQTSSKPYRFKV